MMVYLSPRQLVQSALAGCLSMTIRRELMNQNIPYEDVIVTVDMEPSDDRTRFMFRVDVLSDGDRETIEMCKEKAVNDCYIKGLLFGEIIIEESEENESGVVEDRCCG